MRPCTVLSGRGKVFDRAGECVRDSRPREVGWCGYVCILKTLCLEGSGSVCAFEMTTYWYSFEQFFGSEKSRLCGCETNSFIGSQ